MRGDGALVGTQLLATAAVSLVRPEVLRRVAERDVRGELALETEVERSRDAVAAARRRTAALLLLLGLADAPLVRVEVELRRKVLGERARRTHAQVVAPQVVSATPSERRTGIVSASPLGGLRSIPRSESDCLSVVLVCLFAHISLKPHCRASPPFCACSRASIHEKSKGGIFPFSFPLAPVLLEVGLLNPDRESGGALKFQWGLR